MKLLVDMNLSPRWLALLQGSKIEAAHWASIGRRDALDTEIMAYAAEHGYTVLTNDLDFGTILAATQGEKPSVVQIRSDNLDPDVIGTHVIGAVRKLEGELDSGALVSVEPSRARVRLLPLKPKS
jgi:predicted nuclease of predicted toxin-antitoxin system